MATTSTRTMWKTLLTSQFSCRLPVVGPPMIGVSGGTWAAAIQRAGGLGFLAAGHLMEKNDAALKQEINLYRTEMETHGLDPTFLALGFIGHSATKDDKAWQRYEQLLDQERPTVVQFFAPAVTHHSQQKSHTNISLAQEYGAKVMVQVGNVAEARQALEAGADAIVAQGAEAGGHGLRPPLGRALLPLLADIQSLVRQQQQRDGRSLPVAVLAAGGMTTGAMAAAALCAGADGVVLGTRLWASREALGHDSYKQALVQAASCDDVVRTTVVDQIQNHYVPHPWPKPFDSLGVLQNKVTRQWEGRTDALTQALGSEHKCTASDFQKACNDGNVERGAVLTGQGVGQIYSIDSVADILARVESEMIESIQGLSSKVLRSEKE